MSNSDSRSSANRSKFLLTSGTNVVITEGLGGVTIDLPANLQGLQDVSSSYFTSLGLTGATSSSRYVGATAGGSPLSGTFNLGDYVIDQTGKVWICKFGGSPGIWTQVGGLTKNVENYLNTNLDGYPVTMRPVANPTGIGTGLLLSLNGLPVSLPGNSLDTITVNNNTITAQSQIFFAPKIIDYSDGPLLETFEGPRTTNSFSFYVRNSSDSNTNFVYGWSMSVLIVNPT